MSGLQFAEALNKYISENKSTLHLETHGIHKIEKNPEKSKHLETATTKLYGLDIDFVNLRSEEYTDDSRIPVAAFGTAEEDALRRDATLNALFYNIQTSQIEDLTGTGLKDLELGILRTPLPPLSTFKEDPLRVLRLIRFMSTFNFDIDPEALKAMQSPQIKSALMKKISRERVGIEIQKTLSGRYVARSLATLADLDIYDSVFHLADNFKPPDSIEPSSNLASAVEIMNKIENGEIRVPGILLNIFNDTKLRSIAWLSVALSHWGAAPALNEKGKLTTAAFLIIRDGLKLVTSDATLVSKIMVVQSEVSQSSSLANFNRKNIGTLIRKCGQHWPLMMLYGIFHDILHNKSALIQIISNYDKLTEYIVENDLTQVWDLKPLLNVSTSFKILHYKELFY